MRILKDSEIADFLAEKKMLPKNWQNQFQLREKRNFQWEERTIEISGEANNIFRIILRQSRMNPFDFSIILAYKENNITYRLVRYNGIHASPHTNVWEKMQKLPNYSFDPTFHIHKATERYQELSEDKIDGFAEATTSYNDFRSALKCFFRDNNFQFPDDSQLGIFKGEIFT